jgi:polygalacturonase
MKRFLFTVLIWYSMSLITWECLAQTRIYNILDFGAKGDGKVLNTEAINNAVEKCNREGGGTVVVPPGNYITGTVVLLSNVNLYLEPGSKLTGSKDTADYLAMPNAMFREGYRHYGMIYAYNAKNISITGQGEINGNGTSFMHGIDKPHTGSDYERKFSRQGEEYLKTGSIIEDGPVSYDFRPGLLIITDYCEDVQIRDVHLTDSPEWTIRIGRCENVKISGITIKNNPLIPNSDGIHTTTSRNITISDCNIFAGDDALIVTGFNPATNEKTAYGNKSGIAENVTVTNCILSSRSSCIRVGYGSNPIRNLVFSNLVMHSSNRGIGIFSRDDSSIENVKFSNIVIETRLHSGHWWGNGEPVHISAIKSSSNGNPGKINNIQFSDISATAGNGILIYGDKESLISNVVMNNIDLTITKGKYTDSYGGNIDLRPAYPINFALFKADNPGLFAFHVRDLTINGFKLNWENNMPEFFTNGIEVDNFKNVTIINYLGKPAAEKEGLCAIKLINGIHAEVINSRSTDNSALVVKENVK